VSASAEDLYLDVIDRMDIADPDAPLPPGVEPWQLDVVRVRLLSWEVLNGGFAQYFLNGSGDCAEATRDAARRLGFPLVADRLDDAMARFGAPYPATQAERGARWPGGPVVEARVLEDFGRLAEPFEDLDEEAGEVLELEDALDAIVAAHTRGA
jgi:hypothetical protein